MSRILLEGRFNEHVIPVVIGWDRPLQHCFLQFELDDEQAEGAEFNPLFEVAATTQYQPLAVEDVQASLERAGVVVPLAAFAELRQHMAANVGNAVVRFSAAGERTALV